MNVKFIPFLATSVFPAAVAAKSLTLADTLLKSIQVHEEVTRRIL